MTNLPNIFKLGLKPLFLQKKFPVDRGPGFFNYRRMWYVSMALLVCVSIVPLLLLTTVDYNLMKQAVESENILRSLRVTSNTRRTLTYFLDERLAALRFIEGTLTYEELTDPDALGELLKNLKIGYGGFVDLAVVDSEGELAAFAGATELPGPCVKTSPWFGDIQKDGVFVSDIFTCTGETPHIYVAIRGVSESNEQYILRASLDVDRLLNMLSELETGPNTDAFLINSKGVLQTDSRFYGPAMTKAGIPVPEFDEHTRHFFATDSSGQRMLVAYAYIQDSPFILCILHRTSTVMDMWLPYRKDLLWILALSITVILAVIYFTSTYGANAIYLANREEAKALEQIEQTGRLASIGRLAAGVAHEINNPLAVISERAGLVKDMIKFGDADAPCNPRLVDNIDIVLDSVERCGRITKQLLSFARRVDLSVEELDVGKVVTDVLTFMGKQAAYLDIYVNLDFPDDLPVIRSDRGKLQQILLNLVTNAFQAMSDGGNLNITGRATEEGGVVLEIEDTGTGITPENLQRIFEPFFTTKAGNEGSGLGLSITYGLVRKLSGNISVDSEVGRGTTFTITLPPAMEEEQA